MQIGGQYVPGPFFVWGVHLRDLAAPAPSQVMDRGPSSGEHVSQISIQMAFRHDQLVGPSPFDLDIGRTVWGSAQAEQLTISDSQVEAHLSQPGDSSHGDRILERLGLADVPVR